jgi:hypothetical protein
MLNFTTALSNLSLRGISQFTIPIDNVDVPEYLSQVPDLPFTSLELCKIDVQKINLVQLLKQTIGVELQMLDLWACEAWDPQPHYQHLANIWYAASLDNIWYATSLDEPNTSELELCAIELAEDWKWMRSFSSGHRSSPRYETHLVKSRWANIFE